jgi:hypothetical protein
MQFNQNPELTAPDHLIDPEAKEDFTKIVAASDNNELASH